MTKKTLSPTVGSSDLDFNKVWGLMTEASDIEDKISIIESELSIRGPEKINSFSNDVIARMIKQLEDIQKELEKYKDNEHVSNTLKDIGDWQNNCSKLVEFIKKPESFYEKTKETELQLFAEAVKEPFLFDSRFKKNNKDLFSDYVLIHNKELLNVASNYSLCEFAKRFNQVKEVVQNTRNILGERAKNLYVKDDALSLHKILAMDKEVSEFSKNNSFNVKIKYMERALESYINNRTNDSREYFSFFGSFFSFSRTEKLKAANDLLNLIRNPIENIYDGWLKIDSRSKAAFQQGELGVVFKAFNTLLKDEIIAADVSIEANIRSSGLK